MYVTTCNVYVAMHAVLGRRWSATTWTSTPRSWSCLRPALPDAHLLPPSAQSSSPPQPAPTPRAVIPSAAEMRGASAARRYSASESRRNLSGLGLRHLRSSWRKQLLRVVFGQELVAYQPLGPRQHCLHGRARCADRPRAGQPRPALERILADQERVRDYGPGRGCACAWDTEAFDF